MRRDSNFLSSAVSALQRGLKRALSMGEDAHFHFAGAGLEIEADVTRDQFEGWIADDIARIETTVDRALAVANVGSAEIDRVLGVLWALYERNMGTDCGGAGRTTA